MNKKQNQKKIYFNFLGGEGESHLVFLQSW